MNYMNKKVTFKKSNNKSNFTYITPTSVITTHDKGIKISNNKIH